MRLVLASGSPRREALLDQIGLDFDVVVSDVDETRYPDEEPEVYVERIARAKASAALRAGSVVLAADTAVVFEGRVMGKPGHPDEARAMLERLQGKVHEVFTGLAVACWDDEPGVVSLVDVTEVEMLPMTDEEISDYLDTGEPFDKAGAYALQGIGGLYVTRVSGSPSTVVGMPLHLIPRLVHACGLDLTAFRRRPR